MSDADRRSLRQPLDWRQAGVLSMCWNPVVTGAMVGLGAVATLVASRRENSPVIPVTLGYFTLMEALQFAGYMVLDQCGLAANQIVALLSVLHIVFQPFFINAFAMQLVPRHVAQRVQVFVFSVCGLSSAIMLLQLYPFQWAGACHPGSALCGPTLCTVAGNWHLAWDVPYNGMLNIFDQLTGLGWGFPTYMVAAFAVPLLYGAWRFVIFHAVFGPILAMILTQNPNEVPAVWCLLAIGIAIISLSPGIRQRFEVRTRAPAAGE